VKTLRILTIILSLLIIIGAGHGIGPLGLFEAATVYYIVTDIGEIEFNIVGSYDDRLVAVSLMSLIGQLVLILTFFLKLRLRSALTVVGCVILLAAIFILTIDAGDITLIVITSIFGLPLIVTASMLLFTETNKLINKES